MPKTLKDLFLDKDYKVPFVEKPSKPENIVNSELNGNRPLLQFGKNLPKIYGTDLVRIESRGSIDPARTLAVNSSRLSDTKGGGFGRLLSNLLGQGGAYRPSDTIFENKNSAPITKGTQPVNGDWNALKNAVDADTDYIISQHPANPSKLDSLLNGLAKGNNPKEMAQQAVGKAIGAAQDLITKGITSALTKNRKKVKKVEEKLVNTYDNTNPASEYVDVGRIYKYGMDKPEEAGIKSRNTSGITSFDSKRNEVLNSTYYDDDKLKELVSRHTKSGITNLEFKIGGKIIVLPAALNGDVAETVTAQWNKFQYVGSPFKNYRFNDVERMIRISFKVYWLTSAQQMIARKKLASLRALAFPSSNLQSIKIGTNKYAPLVFTPQITKFSLGNYYRNMNVVVSNVTLGVPQQVSWGSTNPGFTDEISIVYPTAVDVTMDMMIVETHIQNKDNTITYQMDEVIDEPDWVWEPGPEEPLPSPAVTPTEKPKPLPKRPGKTGGGNKNPKKEPEPYKLNFEMPKVIQDNTDIQRPKIRPDGSLYYGGRGSSTG